MKKLFLCFGISVLLAGSLLVCGPTGCTTTNWQSNSGKFLMTTALTVDQAMHGWGVWVAMGKATPQDEAQVKAIYQQYQAYMILATNAYAVAVKVGDPTVFNAPSNNLFTVRTSLIAATQK